MADGLNIYTASVTGNGSALVYTPPAGISHEVAHIRFSLSYVGPGTKSVLINGVEFLGFGAGSFVVSQTYSMILAPGDTISISASGAAPADVLTLTLFVSSYTVP